MTRHASLLTWFQRATSWRARVRACARRWRSVHGPWVRPPAAFEAWRRKRAASPMGGPTPAAPTFLQAVW
eukprot:9734166-Alexandrium_andersonii.AAC.1